MTHHLLHQPGNLLLYCGTWPGRDPETGELHSLHEHDLLIEAMALGLGCCSTCLSPEALGVGIEQAPRPRGA